MTSPKAKNIEDRINILKSNIKYIALDSNFIPNSVAHQSIWVSDDPAKLVKNAFSPNIDPETVKEIMSLEITDGMKVLLLLGIGVFSESSNSFYTEIVKRLAHNKKLFIIIATSDYIYGTNYQFCHGYIGKDLAQMSQEKCIQAMGRVGRNGIQQTYSIRFRDNDLLRRLFVNDADKPEVRNMNRLFATAD